MFDAKHTCVCGTATEGDSVDRKPGAIEMSFNKENI